MINTDDRSLPTSWEIILLWIGANILSMLGGILLGSFLNDFLWKSDFPLCTGNCISIDMPINYPIQRAFVFGLSIGGIKSLLEELVLSKWKIKWKGWHPASTIGWALGVTVAGGLSDLVYGTNINQLLGGIIIGFSQWIILRRYYPKAYWWIIAHVIGCFVILSYIPLGYPFSMILENVIISLVGSVFVGITTSIVLPYLFNLSWLEG